MPVKAIQSVTFIGAGNLATNFALSLVQNGFSVFQVCNRSRDAGEMLAEKTGAGFVHDLKELSPEADLYIISVSDDSLEDVISHIRVGDKMIVHTSGSMNMNILKDSSKNFGVLYPPQTFSKDYPVSFQEVPVCIEANTPANEVILQNLANFLSNRVYVVNSEQRKRIHLGAVIASNFTHFLYVVAEDLLVKEGLDFEILRPIIRQTAENARHKDLFRLQTGPAIREDAKVIKSHMDLLKDHPAYQQMYDLISKMILENKQQKMQRNEL